MLACDVELVRSLKAQFEILASRDPRVVHVLLQPWRFQVGKAYIGQMNFDEFAGVFRVTSRTPNTVTGMEYLPRDWESPFPSKRPEETYEIRVHSVTGGCEAIQTKSAHYNVGNQWPRG